MGIKPIRIPAGIRGRGPGYIEVVMLAMVMNVVIVKNDVIHGTPDTTKNPEPRRGSGVSADSVPLDFVIPDRDMISRLDR